MMDVSRLCGWIPPERRTATQHAAHARAMSTMPVFGISGSNSPDVQRVNLYEVWKHPAVVAANGFAFTGTHQLTGSCVGAGGGDVLFTVGAIEVIRLGRPDLALVPFWLLPYGISRMLLGDHGRGEGSTGSTFAQACRDYGVLAANEAGLPPFTHEDGLIWGEAAEMQWSDGTAIKPEYLARAKRHLVRTTAPCNDHGDVREAIKSLYPCTNAYGAYIAPRSATVRGSQFPVLVGKPNSRGGHQTSYLAWWNHPEVGELFYKMNQWGLDTYGPDPAGGPAGGCWETASTVDEVCGDGEVFAFSQFNGFPAQALMPWFTGA